MWLKLDDRVTEHRKIRRLSDAAFRLHLTALCACAKDETDGTGAARTESTTQTPPRTNGDAAFRGILKAPRKVLVTPAEADRKTSTELAGGDGL